MGAGVPLCETCTLSYARSHDPDDEDVTVEGWVVFVSWNAEPDVRLEARFFALRSTPRMILEPHGWRA